MTSCAFTRGESNSGRESDFGTTPVFTGSTKCTIEGGWSHSFVSLVCPKLTRPPQSTWWLGPCIYIYQINHMMDRGHMDYVF